MFWSSTILTFHELFVQAPFFKAFFFKPINSNPSKNTNSQNDHQYPRRWLSKPSPNSPKTDAKKPNNKKILFSLPIECEKLGLGAINLFNVRTKKNCQQKFSSNHVLWDVRKWTEKAKTTQSRFYSVYSLIKITEKS